MSLTGTFTGGALLMPHFLYSFGSQYQSIGQKGSVVFVQLNGGNDGLNTIIPYDDPLYYHYRQSVGIAKADIIGKSQGLGWHPSLQGLAAIQQAGDLSIIQNVGYPKPNRSHFRSQEIWQTASDSDQYIDNGWLGRYLDLQCEEHQPTAGINMDALDNLALRGQEPNSITVKNLNAFRKRAGEANAVAATDNPQLDFVRKIAYSTAEGAVELEKAMRNSRKESFYPKSGLGRNLEWIARLIKGELDSKVYYTSLGGFDTHDNQLPLHQRQLRLLDEAVSGFYKDIKQAGLLNEITLVIFSEFGRRVKDNGNGTDHGTAAPMIVIGGGVRGSILGSFPNLDNLVAGDLQHDIDFRSVYASLLINKLDFDPSKIGIKQKPLTGLFG